MKHRIDTKVDCANLPEWMKTEEIRKAMNTLKQFSEKERDYHAYQARQNFLRQRRTIQLEKLEQFEQTLEQERLEKWTAGSKKSIGGLRP